MKKIYTLIACAVACALLVIGLYFEADQLNHRPNGFIRLFPPHAVFPLHVTSLEYNSYYIAGTSNKRLYFGNYTAPNVLLSANYSLSDTFSVRINYTKREFLIEGSSKIIIDSPYIYISDGRIPVLFQCSFGNLIPQKLPHDSAAYFLGTGTISRYSAILRIFDRTHHQFLLAKENFVDHIINYAPGMLEPQVDSLFSTDGILDFIPGSPCIVYVYFYRNKFTCLDTNLLLKYRGRTIDTTSQAKIYLAKINSTHTRTFSRPPEIVNKHSCISDKWIFIHSFLKANNEDRKTFDKCSVIDVYSLEDGKYALSFYLPDYKFKKISEFKVFNKTLVAMYDKDIYTYSINF